MLQSMAFPVWAAALALVILLYVSPSRRHSTALHILVIIVLFAGSVAIRQPNIGRPLRRHQEILTAWSLVTLKNWESQGALTHRLCLLQTYPLETDRLVDNTGIQIFDRDGKGYYVSFPPFSIILPYAFFRLISAEIGVRNIQIFNMAWHFAAAILLYLGLSVFLSESREGRFGALLAAVFFLLLPGNLWFFSNIYSWDIFWHYLWVIGICLIVIIERRSGENRDNRGILILLGTTFFLCAYTDNHGVLCALAACIYVWISPVMRRQRRTAALVLAGAAILAVAVMVVQYSSISGLRPLLEHFLQKAQERGSLSEVNPAAIWKHYRNAYMPTIIAILAMLAYLVRSRATFRAAVFTAREIRYLAFVALPIVLHHLSMMQWTTVHNYAVTKSSVLISLLIGILFTRLPKGTTTARILRYAMLALLMAALLIGMRQYEAHYARVFNVSACRDAGVLIRQNSNDDEVVFAIQTVEKLDADSRVIYYAGRNIKTVKNSKEARQWLIDHDRNKGVVFRIGPKYRVTLADRISVAN